MSKWKCEICGNEFENFHAQGFDNKIYCPLCFFKRENQELKKQLSFFKRENQELKKQLEEKNKFQIFIDTQDMEERYSEGLYQDYLEEENKKYKEVIDKIKHYIEKECRIYGLSMPIDVATHLDNIFGILKEVE